MTDKLSQSPELVEAVARMIDPSSWRVLDGYLFEMLRKYKGKNFGYDPEAFKDKRSIAVASQIITCLSSRPSPKASPTVEEIETIINYNKHLGIIASGKAAQAILTRFQSAEAETLLVAQSPATHNAAMCIAEQAAARGARADEEGAE